MKSFAKILTFACLALSITVPSARASVAQEGAAVYEADSSYDVYEFSSDSQIAELAVTVSIPKDCNNHQVVAYYDAREAAYVVGEISTVMGCSRPPSRTKFTRHHFTLQAFRDGSLRMKVPKRLKISMIPIYFPYAPGK
jgi:hypothetical protein